MNHSTYTGAILALLDGLTVYEDEAPDDPQTKVPYTTIWWSPLVGVDGSLADPSTTHKFTFQTTSVGEDSKQALWGAGKVFDKLNRAQPTIAGRTVWPIRQGLNAPFVRRDDLIQPPLLVAVQVWSLITEP